MFFHNWGNNARNLLHFGLFIQITIYGVYCVSDSVFEFGDVKQTVNKTKCLPSWSL